MKMDNVAMGLWLCLGIFTLRVLAQLLVLVKEVSFLPPFHAWYSGAISYPYLLVSQLFLIVIMAVIAYRVNNKQQKTHSRVGQVIKFIAVVYFTVMFIRFVIGLTAVSDLTWLNRPIPAFFHLVLATYLFIFGHYLSTTKSRLED